MYNSVLEQVIKLPDFATVISVTVDSEEEEEEEDDEDDDELDEEEKQQIGGIFSKVIAAHDEDDGHIEEVWFLLMYMYSYAKHCLAENFSCRKVCS